MIWILIVGFALMGLVALVAPPMILAVFGIDRITEAASNEVRAVYGGFGVAMAALLALADGPVRDGVLVTVAIALVGMAAGRVIGAIADRGIAFYPALFIGVELGGAAIAWFSR